MHDSVHKIHAKVQRLKRANADRDQRQRDVKDIRSGKLDNVTPGAIPDAFPYPIVANTVDTTARDMAESMATMPSINCSSGIQTSDRAKKFSAKRTKIALAYLQHSKLEVKQVDFCDHYGTYGAGIYVIEPDFDAKMPRIRVQNPMGTYPEIDMWGRIHSFTSIWRESSTLLAQKFPEYARIILGEDKDGTGGESLLEVVKYCDKDTYLLYLPERDCQVLSEVENRFGKVPVAIAQRPGFDEEVRGAFDDAKWVQLAKARMAMLGLEATEKSVRAPLVLPRDVTTMAFGDDATIRTDGKPFYLDRDVPQFAAAEQQLLEREITLAARTNQVRQGDVDASVITGRGLQQLAVGFSTVVNTGQKIIRGALVDAISLMFEMDEKFWPEERKEIRGVHQGTPFEEHYIPARDINGNYTVDVTYGFAAGLDPSRALVFLLQLRGDNLVPRDFVQRQLPMDIDVVALQQEIDNEHLIDALKQGIMAYAQSSGLLAQQGMDPRLPISQIAKLIDLRSKGKSLQDAAMEAFAPPEEKEEPATENPMAPPGTPGAEPPGSAPPGSPGPPGAAPPGGGGDSDIMRMLAGLTQGGQASMSATVRRQQPIG